jgi:hypothetical protein
VERGTCENAPRTGAPKVLTDGDIRQIKRHIRHDREARRQPLGDIILDLNLPVSERTLKRTIINDIGMGHRIERKTPWLSPKQKSARLAFAKEHLHWGFEGWTRVWWSDEMSMQTTLTEVEIVITVNRTSIENGETDPYFVIASWI